MNILQYLFLIVLCALSATPLYAQQGVSLPPQDPFVPPIETTNPLFGQDHAYTLTMRGNGETVVTARIVVSNQTKSPLATLSFRVPKVVPTDLASFQVLRDPTCIRYDAIVDRRTAAPICAQYQEADYFQYWYGNSKYQKAPSELSTDTISVILPQPIAVGKSGSILLYFRSLGYTKKDMFGTYHYTFETLKVPDTLTSVRIGINVDDDLVLSGAQGKTEYRLADSATSTLSAPQAGMMMADSRIDSLYQQIGYGQVTKIASNLQPLDSYTVKGTYANAVWKLYSKHLMFGVLALVVVGILLVFIGKKSLEIFRKKTDKQNSSLPLIVTAMGVGFSSALFTTVYTVVLLFGSQLLNLYWYGSVQMIVMLLTLIISLGVYCLFLFGPALIIGIKKQYTWGLATFAATILWLVVDLVIVLLVTLFLVRTPGNPFPIPLMERMMGAGLNGSTDNVKMMAPSSVAQPVSEDGKFVPPPDVSESLERM